MNASFVTVISALTTVAVLTHNVLTDATPKATLAIIPAVAAVMCVLWALLVRSYRTLNRAKWAVIGLIEEHLPLRPFAAEYEHTKQAGHRSLTMIEQWVPVVLAVFFVVLASLLAFWA